MLLVAPACGSVAGCSQPVKLQMCCCLRAAGASCCSSWTGFALGAIQGCGAFSMLPAHQQHDAPHRLHRFSAPLLYICHQGRGEGLGWQCWRRVAATTELLRSALPQLHPVGQPFGSTAGPAVLLHTADQWPLRQGWTCHGAMVHHVGL